MNSQMRPYINLYVKRKSELFPLIQKYSGQCPKKMNHGNAVAVYVWLLRNDEAFLTEINNLINKYSNAFGLDIQGLTDVGEAVKSSGSNIAIDPVSNVATSVADVFKSIFGYAEEKEAQDTALYNAILQSQGQNDTVKILVVSGIALAFVGLGIFAVVKLRK